MLISTRTKRYHNLTLSIFPVITNALLTLATSCDDLYKAGKTITGVFAIDPDGLGAFQVRCDMTSTPGKGWTIFQRRVSGSVDFYRDWNDYKNGFGSLDAEFWLGLDKIHRLSQSGQNVLRFDLQNFEGEKQFAIFETFRVANETDGYLLFVANYTGNAGDSFSSHSGMKFSTYDVDNDLADESYSKGEECAKIFKGAWWYNRCHSSNLNGLYLNGSHTSYADGMEWASFGGLQHSLKGTEMKIGPYP